MKNYIVYDQQGKILRAGICPENVLFMQAHEGEFVMEGTANDITQKIIYGKVANKTPEEIEADNPTPIPTPLEKQPAHITNEQWQKVQDRLLLLESKA